MAKVLFRAIRTRSGYPNFANIQREIEKTIENVIKPELLAQFNRIVANWTHKVTFQARKRITNQGITLYVYPTGPNKKLWIWTSLGTKKHDIVPKGPGYPLRFRIGYKPRTWTGLGRKYGGPGISIGPWRSKYLVKHPGTKAREFEKDIARRYQPKFTRHIFRAIRRGEWKL